MQEPSVVNAVGSQRLARFDLTDISERLGLLETDRVSAGIATGHVDDRDTLVLLLDRLAP